MSRGEHTQSRIRPAGMSQEGKHAARVADIPLCSGLPEQNCRCPCNPAVTPSKVLLPWLGYPQRWLPGSCLAPLFRTLRSSWKVGIPGARHYSLHSRA